MTIGDLIRRITVPLGYIPDAMTLGPELPDGWKADAWQAQDHGRGYFLRAWNDDTGQVAIVQSETSYQDAKMKLKEKVKNGGDWRATVDGAR